ncbi:hypothetical protein M153_78240001093, partial [Pseudoloma neurophilia]
IMILGNQKCCKVRNSIARPFKKFMVSNIQKMKKETVSIQKMSIQMKHIQKYQIQKMRIQKYQIQKIPNN